MRAGPAPGVANQSSAQAAARIARQAAIQGFFGPVASARLPASGDRRASPIPAAAVA